MIIFKIALIPFRILVCNLWLPDGFRSWLCVIPSASDLSGSCQWGFDSSLSCFSRFRKIPLLLLLAVCSAWLRSRQPRLLPPAWSSCPKRREWDLLTRSVKKLGMQGETHIKGQPCSLKKKKEREREKRKK